MNELMVARVPGTITFHEVLPSTFIISGTIFDNSNYLNLLLGYPRLNLGHSRGDSLTYPMLSLRRNFLTRLGLKVRPSQAITMRSRKFINTEIKKTKTNDIFCL